MVTFDDVVKSKVGTGEALGEPTAGTVGGIVVPDAAALVGLNVKNHGAVGDGIAIDTASSQNALNAAGVGLTVFPRGTYLVGALSSLIFSKVHGLGAVLKPNANSVSVLTLTAGQVLNSADYALVRDLVIDGTGKTGITGLDNTGGATVTLASAVLENIYVKSCDTVSFNLRNAQFIRTYNLRAASGNGVGMLIWNDTTSGGGNSQDHYGTHLVYKEVGAVVNGTRFATGCGGLVFFNPQVLVNSVCGMAFFDADATIIGCNPEANASGAATKVIDGQTVKRSTFHVNDSTVRFIGPFIAEGDASPVFLVENNSVITIEDLGGYGQPNGLLVQCDATSSVHLKGVINKAIGNIQGVSSWPSGWELSTSAELTMFGEPVHTVDPTLFSVLYAAQTPAAGAGGTNPPAMSYVEDVELGYCRQAVYTAFAGSSSSNVVTLAVGTGAASQDTVVSLLVKSSIDTTIGLQFWDGANFNVFSSQVINLKAGKVTRIVYGKRNIPTGAWQAYWYPIAADAPTIKFAKVQVWQGTPNTQTASAEIAKIIHLGAFNPGPTRDTQTNLRDVTATVNLSSKYPGKEVWDVTNARVVFAAGNLAADVWKDGVNTTVHTPV